MTSPSRGAYSMYAGSACSPASSSTNPTGRGRPLDGVMKIRPPLVFGEARVDVLVSTLDAALAAT